MKKISEDAEKIMRERFGKEENYPIARKLKKVFSEWIDNGHNNFNDENTIILCVELTDGLLLSNGKRYEF